MIPEHRRSFNSRFKPETYQKFLKQLNARCGTEIQFRVSETPCFFPAALLNKMARYGEALMRQLLNDLEYRKVSDASVPAEFNVPGEDALPLFVSVDFGLIRSARGEIEPKLVELQAFPTLYAYQPELSNQYKGSFELASELSPFFGELNDASYARLLRRAIVAEHEAENVVLLEIDPQEQKTLPDFLLTRKRLGIEMVNIRDVIKEGRNLYYTRDGKRIRIERIYNRVIVDELVRKKIKPPFDYRDELDVEWAGHPNWYFRISKFSIPFLKHESVPRTEFLDQVTEFPRDRENWLVKPLYSFAGAGIVFAPSDEQLDSIPRNQRHNYILQERMNFEPVIETPHGLTQAEVRIMYIWLPGGKMQPVLPLVRMGRGKMMGVDHNKNLEWVGGAAALISAEG